MRYTPDDVKELGKNEIFVFGSNSEGIHGKGAALIAKQRFGAIQGQARGLQGRSYAIVTKKNWRVMRSSTLDEIRKEIQFFVGYANLYQEYTFLVTKIGSSLGGYTEEEIKSIWLSLKPYLPDNIILPKVYEVRY